MPIPYVSMVCLSCLHHHTMSIASYKSKENWSFISIAIVQYMMCVNNWVHYGLTAALVCSRITCTVSHYHHYTDLSEGTEHKNACHSNIKSILSIIFRAAYEAVCFRLTHFSFDDYEKTVNL